MNNEDNFKRPQMTLAGNKIYILFVCVFVYIKYILLLNVVYSFVKCWNFICKKRGSTIAREFVFG